MSLPGKPRPGAARSAGFTLLELLVALMILVFAFAIIWSTFSATVTAWQRGGQLLDELRHGDFVMEQLVSALRSAAVVQERAGAVRVSPEEREPRVRSGRRSAGSRRAPRSCRPTRPYPTGCTGS